MLKISIKMSFHSILFIILIKSFLSSPNCINYQNFCNKCNPLTNLCMKCESDIFIPDKNGGCTGAKKCSIEKNYCNECDIFGELCKKCEIGYYPDKNGGCSYTDNCKISNKGECLVCDTDYILLGRDNEFKMCKSLNTDDFKNCKEINKQNGYCWECENGYFINGGDKKCTKVENCYESMYGNCIKCNYGYYLNKKENKCYKKSNNFIYCQQTLDGKNCDICDEYNYFDENGFCVDSNFCSQSLNGKCQKCISKYYLSSTNNICSNEKNCSYADLDTGFCTSCESDFYLDIIDYKCKSNLENNDYKYCGKVIDNQCVQCVYRNFLSKDSKCTPTEKCLEAENGKCLLCEENYYLGLDNKCTNVNHCIYSNNYDDCLECEDNYYYLTLNRTCLEAKDNYENCKISGGYGCLKCKNNYYLNANDSTCIDNTKEEAFYKCAKSDKKNENCAECIEGYFLGSEDKKCILVENCKISENEKRCKECDEYFCLDVKKGICIDNDYIFDENIKYYFACNRTNEDGTSCAQCIEGYEIGENGYCVDVTRCLEEKNGECIRCTEEKNKNGFTYCANKVFGCVESVYDECVRCDDLLSLISCTECKEGYDLYYGGCINMDELEEEN